MGTFNSYYYYYYYYYYYLGLDDSVSEPAATAVPLPPIVQCYEDLVRGHIDNVLSAAVNRVTQTDLSRHLKEWEEKIKPSILANVCVYMHFRTISVASLKLFENYSILPLSLSLSLRKNVVHLIFVAMATG